VGASDRSVSHVNAALGDSVGALRATGTVASLSTVSSAAPMVDELAKERPGMVPWPRLPNVRQERLRAVPKPPVVAYCPAT
jgi:hypothetical protein